MNETQQQEERYEALQKPDEQDLAEQETATKLENALMDTRGQFQGITIREVARIIKQVYDEAELGLLVKILSGQKDERHEPDLPF